VIICFFDGVFRRHQIRVCFRGARDATSPAHIVDLREVENYHAESARAEALRESIEATTREGA